MDPTPLVTIPCRPASKALEAQRVLFGMLAVDAHAPGLRAYAPKHRPAPKALSPKPWPLNS